MPSHNCKQQTIHLFIWKKIILAGIYVHNYVWTGVWARAPWHQFSFPFLTESLYSNVLFKIQHEVFFHRVVHIYTACMKKH